VTTNVSEQAPAEDRARSAFQKIRLPAALALLAVNALWLLIAIEQLLVPSEANTFSDRAYFTFNNFVGVPAIVLPLLAVLLAVAIRPALGTLTRPIVIAALAQYAVSLLFGLIAFLGSLVYFSGSEELGETRSRRLVENAFDALGSLALLAVATLGLVWVLRALLGPRKPKPPAYPGGAPWAGGAQQPYGQPGYPADVYGQQYQGQAGYGGYAPQPSYGQQPADQHQAYPNQPAQAASAAQQPYAHQAYDQPHQGYPQHQAYPSQSYGQQLYPAQGGQPGGPAPSWPAYGQSVGQPATPPFTSPATQVSSPPSAGSADQDASRQASEPPAPSYGGRVGMGSAGVPPSQPWGSPPSTEHGDAGPSGSLFPSRSSWSQPGPGEATNVAPSDDQGWPTPPPEPAAWNAGYGEDEADPTARVSRQGGSDDPWRDSREHNRRWGQSDQS